MKLKFVIVLTLGLAMASCGGDKAKSDEQKAAPEKKVDATTASSAPMSNKGIGPVSSISLGDIDQAMVAEGETVFKAKCTACHKISKKFVGPAMKGVTERRSPEWVLNLLLNTDEMLKKDPITIALLKEHNNAIMNNQNLSEDEAKAVAEYLRTL